MCFCFVLITPPLIWWFHFLQKSKKFWAHVWIFFSTFFLFYYIFQHQCYMHPVLTGCQVFTMALTKNGETWILKKIKIAHHVSLFYSPALQEWLSFFFLVCSESRLEKSNLSPDIEIQCLYHCLLGSGWEMCRPINKVEQSSTSLKRAALYFLSLLCFFPISYQKIQDTIEKMIPEWIENFQFWVPASNLLLNTAALVRTERLL